MHGVCFEIIPSLATPSLPEGEKLKKLLRHFAILSLWERCPKGREGENNITSTISIDNVPLRI